MPGLVFVVPNLEIELSAGEREAVERELALLVREGATYDAAGALERLGQTGADAVVDVADWPLADVHALARALDHLRNLEHRDHTPVPRPSALHELRDRLIDAFELEDLTYELVLTVRAEDEDDQERVLFSFTGPYEPGDRVVAHDSGRELTVVSVEQGEFHDRIVCDPA